jgi:Ca-activated chloride channel family protein
VLTFVVDTSGSMNRENRLGLVKKALYELLAHLRSDDLVGLVVYGSRGQVLLEPTADHEAIRSAIDRLHGAGSTNAEEGLVLAYELAHEHLDRDGINRVILCSDGVANVGRTGPESILERISRYADAGIELTAVGFGMGNYNDVLMEQLADTGDGRYAYVDALGEARRIFVEELTGTLMTIGSEAKAQVEFNPDVVSRYRLLGYENRDIADDRFRDPTVDAGEIGAGHTVTALYEIKLHKGRDSGRSTLATLRMRYRPAGSDEPVELEESIRVRDLDQTWSSASPSLRLASLVAEFAEILKGSYWAKDGDLRDLLRRAQQLSPEFVGDIRVADFVSLVAAAAEIEGD